MIGKIPILEPLLIYWYYKIVFLQMYTMDALKKAKKNQLYYWISINGIINKFLLVGDKFMHEMHLRHPVFTYSAGEPFTKSKEYKNLKKQETQDIFIKKN